MSKQSAAASPGGKAGGRAGFGASARWRCGEAPLIADEAGISQAIAALHAPLTLVYADDRGETLGVARGGTLYFDAAVSGAANSGAAHPKAYAVAGFAPALPPRSKSTL